jgi:putative oxidoreductase
MQDVGLLVLRLAVGLILAAHGAQKLFRWFGGPGISGFASGLARMGVKPSRPFAVISALAEFGGGLLVAIGFLTPVAALVAAGNMLVALVTAHWKKGFWNSKGGVEWPLLLLAAMLAISLTGPGAISLDGAFGLVLPEPITWSITALLALIGALWALLSRRIARPRPAETSP